MVSLTNKKSLLWVNVCKFFLTSTFLSLRALSMSFVVNLRLFPWCMNLRASYVRKETEVKHYIQEWGFRAIYRLLYKLSSSIIYDLPGQFLLFCSWLLRSEQHSSPPAAAPLRWTLPWPSWTLWEGLQYTASADVPPPWLTKYKGLLISPRTFTHTKKSNTNRCFPLQP